MPERTTMEMLLEVQDFLGGGCGGSNGTFWTFDEVEAAEAVVNALIAREEARVPDVCSVCAGEGAPVSGRPCICGGAGTAGAEMLGLRRSLLAAEAREERMASENIATIKAIKDGVRSLREYAAELENGLRILPQNNHGGRDVRKQS